MLALEAVLVLFSAGNLLLLAAETPSRLPLGGSKPSTWHVTLVMRLAQVLLLAKIVAVAVLCGDNTGPVLQHHEAHAGIWCLFLSLGSALVSTTALSLMMDEARAQLTAAAVRLPLPLRLACLQCNV